jgi:type IV secretion system protein VirD4
MPVDLDDGLTDEERAVVARRMFFLKIGGGLFLAFVLAAVFDAWPLFRVGLLLFGLVAGLALVGVLAKLFAAYVTGAVTPKRAEPPSSREPAEPPHDPRYWQPDHSKERPHGDAKLATGEDTPWPLPATAPAKGIPIGRSLITRRIRHYTSDRHLLTVAPNRSGKGRGSIIPALLSVPASCVVIDPKGENCAVTARRRRELGHTVRVLNPFGTHGIPSDSLNPLDAMDPDSEDLPELADELADMLVVVNAGDRDSHWSDEAKALIAGLILHVATSEPPENRHLPRVRDMLSERKEVWDKIIADMAVSEAASGLVRKAANRFMQKSAEEASGVVSTAHRQTHVLDNPRIARVLSSSSFALADLRSSRTTVYLILPPEYLDTHGRWLRLLVGQTLSTLAKVARPAGEPSVLLIIDEAAALGFMKPIQTAMGLLAGYGVQIWPFFQDLAQLKNTYQTWPTFISNAGAIQVFDVRDQEASQYWSDMCGTTTVETRSASKNRGSSTGRGETTKGEDADSIANQNRSKGQSEGESEGVNMTARPLLRPEEVRAETALKEDKPQDSQQLVFLAGERYPLLLRRLVYDLDPEFQGLFDPNPLHTKSAQAVPAPQAERQTYGRGWREAE